LFFRCFRAVACRRRKLYSYKHFHSITGNRRRDGQRKRGEQGNSNTYNSHSRWYSTLPAVSAVSAQRARRTTIVFGSTAAATSWASASEHESGAHRAAHTARDKPVSTEPTWSRPPQAAAHWLPRAASTTVAGPIVCGARPLCTVSLQRTQVLVCGRRTAMRSFCQYCSAMIDSSVRGSLFSTARSDFAS
jgi:hypothetical protein